MRIETFTQNLPYPTALRDYVERRFGYALNRLRHLSQRLTVRLSDENGPKGGIDKSVRVQLSLAGGRAIVVRAAGHDWHQTIDLVARRLANTLSRRNQRQRRGIHALPILEEVS